MNEDKKDKQPDIIKQLEAQTGSEVPIYGIKTIKATVKEASVCWAVKKKPRP